MKSCVSLKRCGEQAYASKNDIKHCITISRFVDFVAAPEIIVFKCKYHIFDKHTVLFAIIPLKYILQSSQRTLSDLQDVSYLIGLNSPVQC